MSLLTTGNEWQWHTDTVLVPVQWICVNNLTLCWLAGFYYVESGLILTKIVTKFLEFK